MVYFRNPGDFQVSWELYMSTNCLTKQMSVISQTQNSFVNTSFYLWLTDGDNLWKKGWDDVKFQLKQKKRAGSRNQSPWENSFCCTWLTLSPFTSMMIASEKFLSPNAPTPGFVRAFRAPGLDMLKEWVICVSTVYGKCVGVNKQAHSHTPKHRMHCLNV